MNEYLEKETRKKIIIGVIVLAALVVLKSCFVIIPTGYTGVRTLFGQVDETVCQNGINFKIPIVQKITKVNNKQQDIKFDEQIWGEAKDKTACYVTDVTVTYYINPEKSAYIFANVSDYKRNLIPQTLTNSAIKSAMSTLSSDDVTKRDKIELVAKVKLQNAIKEKYNDNAVIILKVTINQMDFEESYNKAIANKQIARQEAEKQAIENQKKIDMAIAEQEKAKAEAETKKINAQAEADAMLIKAQAEAENYRIKSAAITDNLLKKWELDARLKHGWVTIQGANTIVKQ